MIDDEAIRTLVTRLARRHASGGGFELRFKLIKFRLRGIDGGLADILCCQQFALTLEVALGVVQHESCRLDRSFLRPDSRLGDN